MPSEFKGKRGRGASGKTPVFGLLKRNGKVYTQVVKNCSVSELMPIIEELASKESTIFSDCFKSYDGLVDYGYKEHFRVIHSKNEFAVGTNHKWYRELLGSVQSSFIKVSCYSQA